MRDVNCTSWSRCDASNGRGGCCAAGLFGGTPVMPQCVGCAARTPRDPAAGFLVAPPEPTHDGPSMKITVGKVLSFAQAMLTGKYVDAATKADRERICKGCEHARPDGLVLKCGVCGCSVDQETRKVFNLAAYEENLPHWGCKHPERAAGKGWPGRTPLLSLVMIIKDEAAGIVRTLESIKPAIDCYTIIDTGSTDDTVRLVRETLAGIPGDVLAGPFTDYADTRNRALDLDAEKHGATFQLMMSGDDVAANPEALRTFCREHLEHFQAAYYINVTLGTIAYVQARLTRTGARPRYKGKVHEVLDVVPTDRVPDFTIACHGASDPNKEREKFERHLSILRPEVDADPSNARNVFYLAQTLECLGFIDDAARWYARRVELGGWEEERYEAMYRAARCVAGTDKAFAERLYLSAYSMRPHRAEPLYALARLHADAGDWALAHLYATRARDIKPPAGEVLFVDRTVYDGKAAELADEAAGRLQSQ